MIFKVVHKFVDMNFDEYFSLNTSGITRGHEYKLSKPLCNNNARQFSFACRRIDVWNSLPANVVSVNTIALFKLRISTINFKNALFI